MAKSKFLDNKKNKFSNVLVIRFSALGDVAMTIPVVYSVCKANPDTRFIMLTQKVASTLFINPPSNLVVVGVDLKKEYKGLKGIYKLFKEIKKKYGIDAVVDLHDVLRTHVLSFLSWMSGIKVKRINKGRAGKRSLTRKVNKRMFPLISSRARYREVFHRFGFKFNYLFESLFEGKTVDPDIFADVTSPKNNGETWIAVAPFAKHKGKIYPVHLMRQVIEAISKWDNVHIFLFGAGEYESSVLSEWTGINDNIISLAGKRHGFPKELALLSFMDVMLSMDSANMHLASLVEVPVVSIWGATHPYCGFMGWRQDEKNSVQLDLVCRPCSVFGNKPCFRKDYFCLTGIPPQMIINQVKNVLRK